MGQATANPPQTEEAAAAASGSSADDLLSQMAGSEIDRLLAAAEDGAPPPSAPAPDAPAVETVADAAATKQDAEPASPIPAGAAKVDEGASASAEASPSATAIPAGEPVAAQVEAMKPPAESAAAIADGPAASVITDNQGGHAESDEPLPGYIRFLDMLNSPTESLPDAFLSAAGKVAVVTLLNAAGLLLYVTFFRHHHGR